MVARAREVGQCMTALLITLGAKDYRTYLAARTRSTNMINDHMIETLHQNTSLFVKPKTRILTTVGTEIPYGGPFQHRYKNLKGRWIETSPTLQLMTTPINVAKLTESWDEVMPSNKKVLDFGFGGIYDEEAVRGIKMFLTKTAGEDGGSDLPLEAADPHRFRCPGAWSPIHRARRY
jgi:hypothetical protein